MNRKSLTLVAAAAMASAALIAFNNASIAAPVSYSTGFEQPTFPLNSNVPSTPPPTLSGWFRQDGTPTATGLPDVNITNAAASSGTQSLRVLNNGPQNQVDLGSVTYAISPVSTLAGAGNVVANGTPFVTIQWDMRVDDGSDIDNTSDTWALDVYDSSANIRTASIARSALAGIAGGTPTSSAIYMTNSTGAYTPASIGAGPASGAWGTYRLEMNYTNHTFAFFLNNVAQGGGPMNVAADNGIDINFTVNGRGMDIAYFDNFSVNAVPEPASLGVVGLALGSLLARRRNRA